MPRAERFDTSHEQSLSRRWTIRSIAALSIAMTPLALQLFDAAPANAAPHKLVIGGTGQPDAKGTPGAPRDARPVHYPADAVNMPNSVKRGRDATLNAVGPDTRQVYTFSQGGLVMNEAIASGQMNGNPYVVNIANPARPDGGLAYSAGALGIPSLQASKLNNPAIRQENHCIAGDPICDYDPRRPFEQQVMGYFGYHLGLNPDVNYGNLRNTTRVVTKDGNNTDVLYIPKGSAPAKRTVEVPTVVADIPAPLRRTAAVAPDVPVYTAPVAPPQEVAPVQAAVHDVAQQAAVVAPQFAPQIQQAEKALAPHLENIQRMIPGIPLPH